MERNTVMTTWKAFVVALPLVPASAAFRGAPDLGSVSTVSGETAIPVI